MVLTTASPALNLSLFFKKEVMGRPTRETTAAMAK